MGKVTIKEKQPVIIRWVHWLNLPLLFIMIGSGIRIYWAEQAYGKIPDTVVENLDISYHLADGMGWHFFIMWPFMINGLIYIIALLSQKHWNTSYSKVQKISYTVIIIIGIGSVLSGLAIYKPVQLGWLVSLMGGYANSRLIHFILMISIVIFSVVHVLQVVRHGWNNFRSMIAGYEIEK